MSGGCEKENFSLWNVGCYQYAFDGISLQCLLIGQKKFNSLTCDASQTVTLINLQTVLFFFTSMKSLWIMMRFDLVCSNKKLIYDGIPSVYSFHVKIYSKGSHIGFGPHLDFAGTFERDIRAYFFWIVQRPQIHFRHTYALHSQKNPTFDLTITHFEN